MIKFLTLTVIWVKKLTLSYQESNVNVFLFLDCGYRYPFLKEMQKEATI